MAERRGTDRQTGTHRWRRERERKKEREKRRERREREDGYYIAIDNATKSKNVRRVERGEKFQREREREGKRAAKNVEARTRRLRPAHR